MPPGGALLFYTVRSMKTHYLYLSGMGDRFDPARKLMLAYWRLRGRSIHLVPMRWRDVGETYEQKEQRIREAIHLRSEGRVVLVGESAGGSMAIRILLDHPELIARVVTVCGFNHTASGVGGFYRKYTPAFYEVVKANDASEKAMHQEASRIKTVFASHDMVVYPKYSRVKGAEEVSIRGRLHLFAIMRIVLFDGACWR